jgi:hypothetical protein
LLKKRAKNIALYTPSPHQNGERMSATLPHMQRRNFPRMKAAKSSTPSRLQKGLQEDINKLRIKNEKL